jgi:hypothetical protein
MESLEALLPSVTDVVSIGWRADDTPFLEFLANSLTREVHCLAVTKADPQVVIERLRDVGNLTGTLTGMDGGFSQFVTARRFSGWFRDHVWP